MRLLLYLFGLSSFLAAQEIPLLKFTGQPLRVPFACTEEDMEFSGLACSKEQPCPVYLELASVAPVGRKLVVSGNFHTESATLFSLMLSSEDGGETWKESAKRIRAAGLDQLQFYDFQNGWAAGGILYPLLRDPFFLVTTDGGETWRQRPVGEEGSPGSIQRFWFDNAGHGELIIDHGKAAEHDRYSQYESQTGGESWNIKGTFSKLPVIRKAPLEIGHPDWRIQSTRDAFVLEKRTSGSWSTAASFLVHVSDCKPVEVELKEPKPDTVTEQKDFVEEMILKGADGKAPAKKKKL